MTLMTTAGKGHLFVLLIMNIAVQSHIRSWERNEKKDCEFYSLARVTPG